MGREGASASFYKQRERLIKSPYISPFRHPFRADVTIWTMAGKGEVLYDSIVEFAGKMGGLGGNIAGFYAVNDAPHDILLMGK